MRTAPLDLIVVPRYADALAVLRQPDLFSSAPYNEFVRRADALIEKTGPEAERDDWTQASLSLLGTDPPRHTRLRKIANRGFLQHRILALAPRIRAIAEELVGRFAPRGDCELVAEFAAPLPITVIAELLGVDPQRRSDFKRWSDAALLTATGNPTPEERSALGAVLPELFDCLDALIEARRRVPRDDLVSSLVGAGQDEEAMSPQELKTLVVLLLVAGNETTTNLLGNLCLALASYPEHLLALRSDPARIPSFVEEVLRWDSPIQLVLRQTTTGVELAGSPLAAGTPLLVLLGSANRDPAQFAEPDRLDPARAARGHLAFGHGTHFCLGAALARLEACIALEVLLSRVSSLECREEAIAWSRSLLVRGPTHLRLGLSPTAPTPRTTAPRVALR
jgi:cytochrome P450